MKQVNSGRQNSAQMSPLGRHRRKAYYHGKYNRELFTTVLVFLALSLGLWNVVLGV